MQIQPWTMIINRNMCEEMDINKYQIIDSIEYLLCLQFKLSHYNARQLQNGQFSL